MESAYFYQRAGITNAFHAAATIRPPQTPTKRSRHQFQCMEHRTQGFLEEVPKNLDGRRSLREHRQATPSVDDFLYSFDDQTGCPFFCARMVDVVKYMKSNHAGTKKHKDRSDNEETRWDCGNGKSQERTTKKKSATEARLTRSFIHLPKTFRTLLQRVATVYSSALIHKLHQILGGPGLFCRLGAARVFARWVSGVLRFSGFLPCGRIHRQSDGLGALGPVFLLRGFTPRG